MSYHTPLVSVMIPTYNQDQYIKKAIQSALDQTYKNIEIIVSDDSENNCTQEIVRTYFSGKVTYTHRSKSKGRVSNYHYMLHHLASGKWIVNLDGDDYFEDNDFIKKAIEVVQKNEDIAFVFAKQIIYNAADNQMRYPTNKYVLNDLLDGNWLFLNSTYKNIEIPHLATMYRKDKAIDLDVYANDRISADRESLLKLCLNNRIGFLDIFAGVWVHHENNTSQTLNMDDFFYNIQMYDELFIFARQTSRISFFTLFLWKILSKYKTIFSRILYLLQSNKRNELKKILKICFFKEFFLFWLLFLDPRFLKQLVKK